MFRALPCLLPDSFVSLFILAWMSVCGRAWECACVPTLQRPGLSISLEMTLCLVSLLLPYLPVFFSSKKSALSFQGHIINRALTARSLSLSENWHQTPAAGTKRKRTGSVVKQIINIFKWHESEESQRGGGKRPENDSLRKPAGLLRGARGGALFETAGSILYFCFN